LIDWLKKSQVLTVHVLTSQTSTTIFHLNCVQKCCCLSTIECWPLYVNMCYPSDTVHVYLLV